MIARPWLARNCGAGVRNHWTGGCLLFALALLARVADSHPAPFSYLDLHLDGRSVSGTLTVHDFDAAHELGLSDPAALLDPATARAQEGALTGVIASRLHIEVDAQSAIPRWSEIQTLPARQSVRMPFHLEAPAPGRLRMDAALFPYDANHQTFVNIYENGHLRHQAVLSGDDSTLTYYAGNAQGRWAVVRTFVAAGFHHILIGPDHVLFLLALLLLGGSLWRLAGIVTAFTVGHSITLSLAALGLVRVSPGVIEPAIALSIVVVGVDNLLVRRQAHSISGPRSAVRDVRPWLAAAFGLLHGFGFAAVLLEFGLPRSALGWSLAAFNIGVELGQLFLVVAMATGLRLLRSHSAALAERCVLAGSAGVIAAGVYWFVQRVWLT